MRMIIEEADIRALPLVEVKMTPFTNDGGLPPYMIYDYNFEDFFPVFYDGKEGDTLKQMTAGYNQNFTNNYGQVVRVERDPKDASKMKVIERVKFDGYPIAMDGNKDFDLDRSYGLLGGDTMSIALPN